MQSLTLDVQRGNVASVMATLPSSRDWSEVGRLPIYFDVGYNLYEFFLLSFLVSFFVHCFNIA